MIAEESSVPAKREFRKKNGTVSGIGTGRA